MTISEKNTHMKAETQLSLMMLVTAISQIIAIYKSTIIAANFGASMELDAYNFTNNLVTFILMFISSGVTTVVIPSYIKKVNKDSINTFISVVFSVVGVALVVLFACRGLLVDILTNREDAFKATVCNVMLLTILIQLIPAFLSVTTAYFQVSNRFNTPKVIQMVSNIAVVVSLICIKEFTIELYLQVLLAGAVLQFVLDLCIALRCGFRFKPCFKISDLEFRRLLKIFTPTVFSSGIYKVNTMIDSVLASNLATGQLTILSYSNTIVGMVNNMFIGNLSTYAYPKIVNAIRENEVEGQKILWRYSILFHTAVCLIVVGFISVGREFIGIFYEHGQFTTTAATRVYVCACIYMVGQQNNIVRDLIYRYFYAHDDTKTTTRNSFTVSIINAILSIILAQFMGLYGLVIGTVLSGVYSIIAIVVRMKHQYGFKISMREPLLEWIKNIFASIISIVFIFILKNVLRIDNYFIGFFIYGILCVLVYVISLIAIKSQVFWKSKRL